MPGTRETFGNPMRIVLSVQALVCGGAGSIDPRISPAIQEVAALTAAPAGSARGFLGGRAVIDDPDFAEVPETHQHLIQIGVVRHRVEVRPVGVGALSSND